MTSHIFSQFDYWKECAEEGNTQAQYNLGLMYYNGEEATQDYSEALKWFRKAAEYGPAKAQFMLGVMYENGLGVDKNDTAALSWYLKAAEQGYTEAIKRCDELAEHVNVNANIKAYSQLRAYKKKRLVQEQRQKYAEEQRKRAEELYCRGVTYLNGEDVTQDYPEAMKCFSEAASLGDTEAEQKLVEAKKHAEEKHAEELYHRGLTYLNEGINQDYLEAIKCFEQAASLGHPEAKHKLKTSNLGHAAEKGKLAQKLYQCSRRYYFGLGVIQDRKGAIKLYRKAAQLGYIPAQDALRQLGETW